MEILNEYTELTINSDDYRLLTFDFTPEEINSLIFIGLFSIPLEEMIYLEYTEDTFKDTGHQKVFEDVCIDNEITHQAGYQAIQLALNLAAIEVKNATELEKLTKVDSCECGVCFDG